MPHIRDAILWDTMKKVMDSGGTIFYDRIRSAAQGTGVARAQISATYAIPQRASALIAISPATVPAAPSAAEGVAGVFDIIGNNFGYQPIELFTPIAGGKLGALDEVRTTPQEWWPTRIPVTPQATYDWGVESYESLSGNGRSFVDLMYATWPGQIKTADELKGLIGPVINSLAQREQAVDGAGDSAGGSLTLADAKELVEYSGLIISGGVVTADEEFVVDCTVRSDALSPIQQFRVGLASVGPIEATSGAQPISELTRVLTPGMLFTTKTPTVNFTYNLDTDVTNAGLAGSLLRFLKA